MTPQGWLLIVIFAGLMGLLVKPLGGYMAAVFTSLRPPLRPLGPLERGLYRLAGVDPAVEQGWLTYAMALLAFHLVGIALLYGLQRLQATLPLNPGEFTAVAPDLALNTAVSFATNTSWQSYGGETTMSYL
ncbi:MAG: potassium-transporting ATPase subunit KdpA, partial [Nevskiales bacterium]